MTHYRDSTDSTEITAQYQIHVNKIQEAEADADAEADAEAEVEAAAEEEAAEEERDE